MDSIPKQLSVKEISEPFNIPENTLRAYMHRRIIPYRKVLGRLYLVPGEIQEWLSGFDVKPRIADDCIKGD